MCYAENKNPVLPTPEEHAVETQGAKTGGRVYMKSMFSQRVIHKPVSGEVKMGLFTNSEVVQKQSAERLGGKHRSRCSGSMLVIEGIYLTFLFLFLSEKCFPILTL